MDPALKPERRMYVVLLFVQVDKNYYDLGKSKREELTAPHVKKLSEHLKCVSITSLQSTGLAGDIMIEVLESENLLEIEKMVETYKAGAKSRYGAIKDVIITEKCMELKMTG